MIRCKNCFLLSDKTLVAMQDFPALRTPQKQACVSISPPVDPGSNRFPATGTGDCRIIFTQHQHFLCLYQK